MVAVVQKRAVFAVWLGSGLILAASWMLNWIMIIMMMGGGIFVTYFEDQAGGDVVLIRSGSARVKNMQADGR
jgi:hypothetical protein